jgi:long-chain fatty acid transport protein
MHTLSTYSTKILGGLLLSPLLLGSHGSLAGGFQLSDHSITALGRAQAGYGIVGDDASAAHFNPAGMSLLKRSQFQLGAAFIQAEGKFTDTGSTGANTGVNADGAQNSITPNIYLIIPINERTRFGLGITSPFASNTDYQDDFVGRFSGLETNIETININPSLSYKINDLISVGFGLSYQKFDVTLSGAVSPAVANSRLTIEGDSAQVAYNFGAMFSFADKSHLGISYRSKTDHDIKGTATFSDLTAATNGTFAATADFTTPETVYVAYNKPLTEKWDLSLGYRWTRWSRFQRLDILFPTGVASQSSFIDAQWNDVKTIALGTDYQLNKKWTVRAGLAFDDSPIPDSTRSVRTVDADRTWYSVGTSYKATENLQWDFAYRYIKFDNAPVDQNITRSNTSIGSLTGEFNDINIHTLALQMNYKY